MEAASTTRRCHSRRTGAHLDEPNTTWANSLDLQLTADASDVGRASGLVGHCCYDKVQIRHRLNRRRAILIQLPQVSIQSNQQQTAMSLFEPKSSPVTEVAKQQATTSATIIIFIVISAIGSSAVVGFVLFVAWYRVKKKREQNQAAAELVELSVIEAVLQASPARQH